MWPRRTWLLLSPAAYIRFQEDLDHHGAGLMSGLRSIVIVGHTPQHDLEIIRRLGVQIARIAPVAAVLDTHRLSKCNLGTGAGLLAAEKHLPLEHHALLDVLGEFGVPHDGRSLHDAGNDATYTLHGLILLAIRWAESTYWRGGTRADAAPAASGVCGSRSGVHLVRTPSVEDIPLSVT